MSDPPVNFYRVPGPRVLTVALRNGRFMLGASGPGWELVL
jgi:hypothetical protein